MFSASDFHRKIVVTFLFAATTRHRLSKPTLPTVTDKTTLQKQDNKVNNQSQTYFFESSLSTGPNRSRLTRAAVMRAADVGAGRRPMAGERSVDISDSIIGLYTLALMFILFVSIHQQTHQKILVYFGAASFKISTKTHNKTRFYFSRFSVVLTIQQSKLGERASSSS